MRLRSRHVRCVFTLAVLCTCAGILVPTSAFAAPLQRQAGKPGTKHATPYGYYCDPGGSYTNASHASSDRFYGISPVFHNYNGTHQYEDMQGCASKFC